LSVARELESDADIRAVLESSRVVAVLGAHHEASRPAFYVPDYLEKQGYHVIGVNPVLAGQELFGHPVLAKLTDVNEPVDLVDVFRRADLLPQHSAEILAMNPHPKVVWLQLGIRNDAFAKELVANGIDVIQDRCTLAEHRRFGLGRVG
jgi:predicted CoA-binding protein